MILRAMRQLVADRMRVSLDNVGLDAMPRQLMEPTEVLLLALDVESSFHIEITDNERRGLHSLADWVALVGDRVNAAVTVA